MALRLPPFVLAVALLPALLASSPESHAQTETASPAKICADRWNDLKAQGRTGSMVFRDFAEGCLKENESGSTAAQGSGNAPSGAQGGSNVPTGRAAADARPSIKQCADLWNELKAKNQTGKLTYRDFAQQCLAGALPPSSRAESGSSAKDTPPARTSVPSVGTRSTGAPAPVPAPAPSLQGEPTDADREAVNRCNAEWGDYKARHKLSGAKAWHVFMARCLP